MIASAPKSLSPLQDLGVFDFSEWTHD